MARLLLLAGNLVGLVWGAQRDGETETVDINGVNVTRFVYTANTAVDWIMHFTTDGASDAADFVDHHCDGEDECMEYDCENSGDSCMINMTYAHLQTWLNQTDIDEMIASVEVVQEDAAAAGGVVSVVTDVCITADRSNCFIATGQIILTLANRIIEDCVVWGQLVKSVTEVDRDGNNIELSCFSDRLNACKECVAQQVVNHADAEGKLQSCSVDTADDQQWRTRRC